MKRRTRKGPQRRRLESAGKAARYGRNWRRGVVSDVDAFLGVPPAKPRESRRTTEAEHLYSFAPPARQRRLAAATRAVTETALATRPSGRKQLKKRADWIEELCRKRKERRSAIIASGVSAKAARQARARRWPSTVRC